MGPVTPPPNLVLIILIGFRFPGVLIHSRVTGACPVTTDLMIYASYCDNNNDNNNNNNNTCPSFPPSPSRSHHKPQQQQRQQLLLFFVQEGAPPLPLCPGHGLGRVRHVSSFCLVSCGTGPCRDDHHTAVGASIFWEISSHLFPAIVYLTC